jgi:hypothetical protein
MPKNQVIDPITDQEIAFAHLVLSGTMTDRAAAEAAGLNPDTAAYTKAKPRVRAYMLDHRAAVHERLVEQETEGLRRLNLGREQVLTRLWEIANLSPEMTRGSVTAQVKALTMIVAIEGLIPAGTNDRRAVSSENKSAPPPTAHAWRREQQGKTTIPHLNPEPVREEDDPGVPDLPPGAAAAAPPGPGISPGPAFESSDLSFAHPVSPVETIPSSPFARVHASAPDTRVPFSTQNNPFTGRP